MKKLSLVFLLIFLFTGIYTFSQTNSVNPEKSNIQLSDSTAFTAYFKRKAAVAAIRDSITASRLDTFKVMSVEPSNAPE